MCNNNDESQNPYHEGKKSDKKIYCMILFIYNLYAIGNANKPILTESRSMVIWRLWRWRLETQEGRDDHKETFWGNLYVCYLDYDDSFMGVYMRQNLSNWHFKYVQLIVC